jgi:hypothetical protein
MDELEMALSLNQEMKLFLICYVFNTFFKKLN